MHLTLFRRIYVDDRSSNAALFDHNTVFISGFHSIESNDNRCLRIVVLRHISTCFVCLVELSLQNAKLIVHQTIELDLGGNFYITKCVYDFMN